jgi:predicted chitinase
MVEIVDRAALAMATYGLPPGSRINYGTPGFPDWVYQLAGRFNIRASTYPGHQESNRNEAGFAPNPQRLNRGIDWAGSVDNMQRFADYCLSIRGSLEQVIWQNPNTGRRVGVAGGKDVSNSGYYADNYAGHRDHVHTRQSAPLPLPGAAPAPPSIDRRAEVLSRAVGNMNVDRAKEILSGVTSGLQQSQCGSVDRIAMWLAQIGHESANFRATEEFQSGDESTDRWKYKGRTWIQITWHSNYADFSRWAFGKGLVSSPTYFVDRPKELADMRWAGVGPAWYWTVQRPKINSMCDARDLEGVTRAINGGLTGFDDRRNRWFRALALGTELLTLISGEEDEMSAEAERMIREIHALYVTDQLESLSPLKKPGEGRIANIHLFLRWMDSNVHVLVETLLASLGDPACVARLREVAEADVPGRNLARAILSESQSTASVTPPAAPAPTPISAPTPSRPAEPDVEVLPAIRPPSTPAPTTSANTPEALLEELERLDRFNRDYREKFDQLTKGSEE